MDIREKLVEMFDEAVKICGETRCDRCDYFASMKCVDERVADHLIANGVTVSEEALPVADKATERSVAVEKTEDQRKPEGFIGHRKLEQEWIPVTDPPKEWRRDNGEMINYLVYVPEFGVDIGNYGEPAKCWLCMGIPCKPTHWAHLPTPPKQEG